MAVLIFQFCSPGPDILNARIVSPTKGKQDGTRRGAQCTVYSSQCTVHTVQCTLHNARCTVHSAQRSAYTVQLIPCAVVALFMQHAVRALYCSFKNL